MVPLAGVRETLLAASGAEAGSDSLGKRNGGAAAGADHRGQQRVSDRVLGAGRDCGLTVLELLGLELGDRCGEIRIVIPKLAKLIAVMLVDLRLDGGCAGHSRIGSYQGRDCAERMTCHVPERLEQGWPHSAVRQQLVEMVQVALLLDRHSRNCSRGRVARPKHRQLAGVDPGGSVFPGLVHSKHRGHVWALVTGAPPGDRAVGSQIRAFGRLRLNHNINKPNPMEMIAFHPAMEMPRNENCTSSQRMRGRAMMSARTSPDPPDMLEH